MLRSAALHTYELDDVDAAVTEIRAGLEAFPLMEHSVGVIMCDPEYIESGVYGAVCAALPFPVAGATTLTQAVDGAAGILMLTVLVLTGDDVFFSVAMTEEIAPDNDVLTPTRACLEDALGRLPSEPKLILAFPPIIAENAGDAYVEAFAEICPGVPIFGTLAASDSIRFDNCSALCNGSASLAKMSFIAVAGAIEPRFAIATVGDRNKTPYSGEITRSEKNVIHEINGVSTYEYFESIGLAKDDSLDEGLQFVPVLIDFKKRDDYDGIPVVRAIVGLNDSGGAICRGYMHQDSVFTVVSPTQDDILKSSGELLDKLLLLHDRRATLIFSCVVRRMMLGTEPLLEASMIEERLRGGPTFMLGYAGGEICPTSVREKGATNRFHNYSIIACIL
ncbi:MAG: FIST C-terminal domain-containing protein [Clostridiales Family XIII bacterium]|jgi:hypothetical protein|nr:FIST C-terminal domain-containing protein [Clostridiales Family XIII bacterium]